MIESHATIHYIKQSTHHGFRSADQSFRLRRSSQSETPSLANWVGSSRPPPPPPLSKSQSNQGTYWGVLISELHYHIFAPCTSLSCKLCGASTHPATAQSSLPHLTHVPLSHTIPQYLTTYHPLFPLLPLSPSRPTYALQRSHPKRCRQMEKAYSLPVYHNFNLLPFQLPLFTPAPSAEAPMLGNAAPTTQPHLQTDYQRTLVHLLRQMF